MTITELKEKYQNDVQSVLEYLGRPMASNQTQWMYDKLRMLQDFISDLDTVIQSEEKEMRELLDRYTKYLLTQNTISLNPKTVDYDEMRKLVINRFLESEKGGEL